MSGSLEDLRDSYKNSRRSKQAKKAKNKLKNGYIAITDTTSKRNTNIDELNNQFDIHVPHIPYSMNKKKRWQLQDEFKAKMGDLKFDQAEVNLYETLSSGNKIQLRDSYKSKDVNKTDSSLKKDFKKNYLSIREQEAIDIRNRNQPKSLVKVKKTNRFKMGKAGQATQKNERITIEDAVSGEDDDEDTEYAGRFEYVLNYEDESPNKWDSSKVLRKKGVRHSKRITKSDNEDLFFSDCEEPTCDSMIYEFEKFENSLTKNIEFEELVTKFAVYLVEKQKLHDLKDTKEIQQKL